MNNPEYFREKGWHQGDVIDDKSAIESLINCSGGITLSIPPELLVVISHTCDILHQELNEPYIDLLIGHYNKKDNVLVQGRNPRKLQIDNLKGTIEFIIYNIVRITKNDFEEVNPVRSSLGFNKSDIKLILNWVSKRYIRAAFPDEFMRRLPKKDIDILQKNPHMNNVSLIFIDVNDIELNHDQDYDIIIIIGVQKNKINSELKEILENLFYDTFNVKGIILTDLQIHDENDITYEIMSTYKRFDWDFRSLPENENTAIPFAGIDTE